MYFESPVAAHYLNFRTVCSTSRILCGCEKEAIPIEGTMRAHGITHKTKLYIVAPPNFDIKNLASLEIERSKKGSSPQEVKAEEAEENKTEDILTEATDAEEVKAEAKTPIQLEFEKKAGVSLFGVWCSVCADIVSLLRGTIAYAFILISEFEELL